MMRGMRVANKINGYCPRCQRTVLISRSFLYPLNPSHSRGFFLFVVGSTIRYDLLHMENASHFTAKQEDAGKRLDIYLTEQLSGISRSQIKKMIQSGHVFIDKKPVSVHQFLKEGDEITLSRDAMRDSENGPEDAKGRGYVYIFMTE